MPSEPYSSLSARYCAIPLPEMPAVVPALVRRALRFTLGAFAFFGRVRRTFREQRQGRRVMHRSVQGLLRP